MDYDVLAGNGTVAPSPGEPLPMYVGFIAAAIAVLFFGSNFAPVKKFETGDGMFFQWILCSGIWFTAMVVEAATGFKPFYPLAMLGGFLWCVGNTMVVPIIKTIGLSQGILIWGSCSLFIGWASGRFGFFGLTPEIPNHPTLNYIGIGLCLLSAVIYIFIKSDAELHLSAESLENIRAHVGDEDADLLIPKVITRSSSITISPDTSFTDHLSPIKKRVLGSCLALISGILYGVNFIPVIYIQNRYPGASQNGLDYVFAHFSGIFTTSTIFFIIYCVFKRNAPKVYPRVILPGFISGVMWGIADAGWFIANATLSEAISFPIISAGPGIIAALWGVFLFKEIKGKKNLLLLLFAFVFVIAGSVTTGFSKSGGPSSPNTTLAWH